MSEQGDQKTGASCSSDMEQPNIENEVQFFVEHANSLVETLGMVMAMTEANIKIRDSRLLRHLERYGKIIKQSKEGKKFKLDFKHVTEANQLRSILKEATTANRIIPRVFVIALISQYDAFIGRLLRALFALQPGLLESAKMEMSFPQLVDFGTMDNAIEYVLEKEVETVLRKSHADQFAWIADKLKVKLKSGLDSWPLFIELTERRNLFAHCNGIVSEQYLTVCNNNGVKLDSHAKKGAELGVTAEYFEAAYECILEIGIKLSQVLWRKIMPDQLDEADGCLQSVTYNFLLRGKYRLAQVLLDFACSPVMKYPTEQRKLVHVINRAQANKWSGRQDVCLEIIDGMDWSASGPDFQVAVAVLQDRHDDACALMRRMGKNGDVGAADYQSWPVFKEFRKTELFADTYSDIFNEPFVSYDNVDESISENLKKILTDLAKIDIGMYTEVLTEVSSANNGHQDSPANAPPTPPNPTTPPS